MVSAHIKYPLPPRILQMSPGQTGFFRSYLLRVYSAFRPKKFRLRLHRTVRWNLDSKPRFPRNVPHLTFASPRLPHVPAPTDDTPLLPVHKHRTDLPVRFRRLPVFRLISPFHVAEPDMDVPLYAKHCSPFYALTASLHFSLLHPLYRHKKAPVSFSHPVTVCGSDKRSVPPGGCEAV